MQNNTLLLPNLKMLMLAEYLSTFHCYFSVITFTSNFKIQKSKEDVQSQKFYISISSVKLSKF